MANNEIRTGEDLLERYMMEMPDADTAWAIAESIPMLAPEYQAEVLLRAYELVVKRLDGETLDAIRAIINSNEYYHSALRAVAQDARDYDWIEGLLLNCGDRRAAEFAEILKELDGQEE